VLLAGRLSQLARGALLAAFLFTLSACVHGPASNDRAVTPAGLVDQAINACLIGNTGADVVTSLGALGWPAFQSHESGARQRWEGRAVTRDAGRVALLITEVQMRRGPLLSCTVLGPAVFGSMFQDKFETRFPGAGDQRPFAIEQGEIRMGEAAFSSSATNVGTAQIMKSEEAVFITVAHGPPLS
jgi:hypothetical protein